jgi:hypothetical protein
MNERPVKAERTGWRDEGLSRRHRLWGWDCPAVDVDFLLVEYDRSEPKAIIEYKSVDADMQTSKHPSYVALRKLADAAHLPLFAVRYGETYEWWNVTALNDAALTMQNGERLLLYFSEADYVRFLYEVVRGRPMPEGLALGGHA